MNSNPNALSQAELARLSELEEIIDRYQARFHVVASALYEIKQKRLWRNDYTDFSHYVQARFAHIGIFGRRISNRRIHQITRAGEVLKDLSGFRIQPNGERQVRRLSQLPSKSDRCKAWADAVKLAGGKVPTAAQVDQVLRQFQHPKTEQPTPMFVPIGHKAVTSQLVEFIELSERRAQLELELEQLIERQDALASALLPSGSGSLFMRLSDSVEIEIKRPSIHRYRIAG
jgi:hypothetical protein